MMTTCPLRQGTTGGGLPLYPLWCKLEDRGEWKEDVVLIFWTPESAFVKSRMIYASSKNPIKKKLKGIKHELWANWYEEVKDYSTLAEKLVGGRDSSVSLWRAALVSPLQLPAWSRGQPQTYPLGLQAARFLTWEIWGIPTGGKQSLYLVTRQPPTSWTFLFLPPSLVAWPS